MEVCISDWQFLEITTESIRQEQFFSPPQQKLLDRNQIDRFLHDSYIKGFCQEERLVESFVKKVPQPLVTLLNIQVLIPLETRHEWTVNLTFPSLDRSRCKNCSLVKNYDLNTLFVSLPSITSFESQPLL